MCSIAVLFLLSICSFVNALRRVGVQSRGTALQRPGNVHPPVPMSPTAARSTSGSLYVDDSCIGCGVCRWVCSKSFVKKGVKAAVRIQPQQEDDKLLAYAAMAACPVGAIKSHDSDPLIKAALDVFPAEIDPMRIPGVCHAGYHSASSSGATPYFVRREGGNFMIDCPRFDERLAANIESEGGLAYMILTHKDSIADHVKWKERFPQLVRVIHRLDVTAESADCEVKLDIFERYRAAPDVLFLHTPGHTAGSLCVHYTPGHPAARPLRLPGLSPLAPTPVRTATAAEAAYTEGQSPPTPSGSGTSIVATVGRVGAGVAAAAEKVPKVTVPHSAVLFTGDHLALAGDNEDTEGNSGTDSDGGDDKGGSRRLTGFKAFNHGSVVAQAASIELLADPALQFDWILPGHGRMLRFTSQEERRRLISEAAEQFKRDDQQDFGGLAGIGFL